MTENELLRQVLQVADELGVFAFHSTDSRRDIGRGFADIVFIGQENVLFCELKTAVGGQTTAQRIFAYRVLAAGAAWVLWRPRDLEDGTIKQVLSAL